VTLAELDRRLAWIEQFITAATASSSASGRSTSAGRRQRLALTRCAIEGRSPALAGEAGAATL
jgi:hypothetical protein